jgi:hypothetical protein
MQTWACLVVLTASGHHVPLPCEVGKLSRCKGRCGAHPNAHNNNNNNNNNNNRHHRHNYHPNVEVGCIYDLYAAKTSYLQT